MVTNCTASVRDTEWVLREGEMVTEDRGSDKKNVSRVDQRKKYERWIAERL